MKTPKIKRYRLGVSRNFPTTHPRKWEPTGFADKICHVLNGTIDWINSEKPFYGTKIHTIRANYQLWEKRMKEVQAGRAVIELFYWSGKPYHKDENGIGQVVFATLDKDSGCGVQKLGFYYDRIDEPFIDTPEQHIGYVGKTNLFAKNDGLSIEDFKAWFKGYDLSEPMAIIHFTSFRY